MSNTHDKPAVQVRGLHKHYGAGESLVRAVDGVDLDVAPGETVAVMGPSGCGKSTLLHLVGGLDRPTSGQIWLDGRRTDELSERDLARMRRTDIGFAEQSFEVVGVAVTATTLPYPEPSCVVPCVIAVGPRNAIA